MNEANSIDNNNLNFNDEQELTTLSEVGNIGADISPETALGGSSSADLELVDSLADSIERLDLTGIESDSELELFGGTISSSLGLTAEDESSESSDDFTGDVRVLGDSDSGYTPPDNLNESIFTSGEYTQVTLSIQQRDAKYRNEVGLYRTDDATGRIGSLSPGDDGYAAAALDPERRIATVNHNSSQVEADIEAGTFVGSYLVQNNTSQRFLQKNSANRLGKKPLAFFSFTEANPDGFDHLQSTVREDGSLTMAWEDLTGGGDGDFTDSVFTMSFSGQAEEPSIEVGKPANYTIIAEGKVKFRGEGDFDGDELIAEDDTLVYAGSGFELKGQPILPVQRDESGDALLNDGNQQLLVEGAVNVSELAADSKIPPSQIRRYSGLIEPQVVETQTVEVPDYALLVESQYSKAVGDNSNLATVPANTRLNNRRRWLDNFPAPGTPENPTVVTVKRNGLTVPSGIDLENYVIIVERGNVKFKGGEQNLNNVTIIAERGKIELNRVNSTNSSFLAAKSIKTKHRTAFFGDSLIANDEGKVEISFYNGGELAAENLKVVAASDLKISSNSQLNGEFITAGDFKAVGPMSIHGSVAAKGDAELVGRIKVFAVTDDTPEVEPPVATVESVTVTEASGIASVTVNLDSASTESVSVDYVITEDLSEHGDTAVAGSDYQAKEGTVTFNPGETTKAIEVELIEDAVNEPDETFVVRLTNPNGLTLDNDSAVVTITDDDELPELTVESPSFSQTGSESGTASFTVSLNNPSSRSVTVDYATVDDTAIAGADYEAASGTITFEPGETSKTIVVPILSDSLYEADESFSLILENLSFATIDTESVTATIINDDPLPELSVNSVVVTEDSGMVANFEATLSEPSGVTVTVDFTAEAATATEGSDFTGISGTITFEPGQTRQTIAAISILEDSLDEIDEMFTIELSNVTNAEVVAGSGTAIIEDNDDSPELSVSDLTIAEGDEGTAEAVFEVALSQASGKEITVDYATADDTAEAGVDYEAVSGTLTFAPGETSKTVTVGVNGDLLDEIDESFLLSLDNAVNATFAKTTAQATVSNDDEAPIAAVDSVSLTEGDEGTSTAVFTVTLDNASGRTITIDYATEDDTAAAGSDYVAQSGTLTFEPGETSKTIEVEVVGDLNLEEEEAFTVNLSNPTFVNISEDDNPGTGIIANDDEPLKLDLNLANDTGIDSSDNISQDVTLTGVIENIKGDLTLNASWNDAEPTDISDVVRPDGSFNLGIEQLQQLNGGNLDDGTYTLKLTATDSRTGNTVENELTFTKDATATTLNLVTPLVDGAHSSKPRLIGQLDDASNLEYVLNDGQKVQIEIGEEYKFDAAIGNGQLSPGIHNLVITATDVAGNITETEVSFAVGDSFTTPDGTRGWGAKNENTVVLGEQDSYVVQTQVPVELGLETNESSELVGTRTISFDIDTAFDEQDLKAIEDQLLVYLVDPTNPSQTLLDNGVAGTAVFTLAGSQADFTPGLVSFDGKTVTIDASSLTEVDRGLLVFQLLNQDDDTGSVVTVNNLASTADAEGFVNPVFPEDNHSIEAGGELNLANLNSASDVVTVIEHVRFDAVTGEYKASLSLKNNGESAVSRNSAVIFNNLPEGVELVNPSGIDDVGNPYLNLRPAIRPGGLDTGGVSASVEVVLSNPNLVRFGLDTSILVGSPNAAPLFEPLGNLTVTPGQKLKIPLSATDVDGDNVTYKLEANGELPTGMLDGGGTLKFNPAPDEIGSYEFTIIATDRAEETSQTVTLNVVADPVTTTRISGVIENVEQQPLAGVVIELGELTTVTNADGSFTIETDQPLTDDTLKVRGEEIEGDKVYPFIAEKLPLVLGQDVYEGYSNVIERPIYLPALDVESGKVIDPNTDITVTTDKIPGASVFVEAGSLSTQSGEMFTGTLSITEVPPDLTPAALPENISPDMVVTIQPGEMAFNTPAPLSLPNRAGWAAGFEMDLWSINPETGDFDIVGTGKVSDDGSIVETIEGGIRNSSWHMFAGPGLVTASNFNPPPTCDECQETAAFKSEVELHTGAVIEDYDLVSYTSNGETRGVRLTYDSLRADPRPIVKLSYDDFNLVGVGGRDLRIIADLTIEGNSIDYEVPGNDDGENSWLIPRDSGDRSSGDFTVSMQADLREFKSGKYQYSSSNGAYVTGTLPFSSTPQAFGTSSTFEDKLLHVNSIDSAFGSGWGIDGWQEIAESEDGSLLLIDGDGSELWFDVPESEDEPYVSPPGDFSILEKLADGTFRRTMKEGMVYDFNRNNYLSSVTDTNGNSTNYVYDGQQRLTKIVDPVGLETTFNYNSSGKVSSIVDPARRETFLEYDATGNLIQVINPDSSTSRWSYDGEHHMINEIDAEGNSASATYDEFGRATSAITEDGSVVQISPIETLGLYTTEATAIDADDDIDSLPNVLDLDDANQAAYADANGNVTASKLDSSGQKISAIDGGGATGSTERNEENLVVKQVDSRGNSTEYTYDERGNVTQITEDLFSSGLVEETGAEFIFKNPLYRTGDKPTSIAVGDLNNDGYPDVVTANNNLNHGISILFGNERETLNPKKDLEINLAAAGGSSQRKIFLEDLNSDSNLDLITLGSNISVSLGNGDGTFQETTYFGSKFISYFGLNSKDIVLEDLNNDNLIDLALTNNDKQIYVYHGNGDGTFASPDKYVLEDITDYNFLSIQSGDIDTDGDKDLAVTYQASSSSPITTEIAILSNNGSGIFAPINDFSENLSIEGFLSAYSPELVDINGDNTLDLIASYSKRNYFNETAILLGNGDGTFSQQETFDFGGYSEKTLLSVADINQDGYIDIVNSDGYVIDYRLGNGDGTFADKEQYRPGPFVDKFILEDLNLDGNLDFLSIDGSEYFSVRYGKVDGAFDLEPLKVYEALNPIVNPPNIQLQDLNIDGLPDLIFQTRGKLNGRDVNSIDVALGNGDGSFREVINTQPTTENGIGSFSSYELEDIDNNGILDLITIFPTEGLYIQKGNGDGSFGSQIKYSLGEFEDSVFSQFILTGDLDGDSDLDIVVDLVEGLLVFFNDGSGSYTNNSASILEYPYKQVGSLPFLSQRFSKLDDIDNDGDLDLLYTETANSSISNIQDTSVANPNYLEIAINDGNGNFSNETRLALDSNFYYADAFESEDLDGDGDSDLVASTINGNSKFISVLLNNGDGTFGQQVNYQPDSLFQSRARFALDDLNSDGNIDIVVSSRINRFDGFRNILNDIDGKLSVYLGNGDGSFRDETPYSLPGYGNFIDLADLDNDSDSDLVFGYILYPDDSNVGIITTKLNQLNESDAASGSSTIAQRSYQYESTFNKLTSEIDELGRQTLYDINPENGNLLSTTQVVGKVGGNDDVTTSYTYTDAGLVDTITDSLGRITDYDYDERGNLIRATSAVGTTDEARVSYEYDLAGNQTAMIDENGNRSQFEYDAKNRLIKSTYAVGTADEAVEITEYDDNGNQIATVDANGNRTEYKYDEKDRLIETISPDPDGDGEQTSPISTSTYDSSGNLIAITDSLGRETRYIYDSRNRLVETVLPDGTSTQAKYDTDNNLVSASDAAGESTNKIFDARGRLIRETDPQGNVIRYQYDAADQLLAVVDGNGNRTSYEYDELGRQISVTDGEGNTTYTEYDKVGNVVATIDGNKNRTEYEFDERDRNTQVTDPEGGTTTTEYDKVGNVVSITDPVSNQTSYTYDAQNRVVVETNELGFTRTFEYDDVGNSISTTDRNGREREFQYDGLNRQVEENWLDDAGNSIRTTNSKYDAASQLVATDDPDSAYNFTYDELGRVVTVDNAGTPGVPQVVLTYSYDAEGNIISVSDTIDGVAGATTAYNYDELDRVDLITQSGENVADKRVDFAYDAIGQYESITRYSDLEGTSLVADSSYTYDDTNRLTNLNHSNSNADIANYDITYDAASRITQIVDADGTNDYSYDKRDQLIAADHSDESNADEIYSYDLNGNRTESSLHGSGYVTDANNRLASDGTYNYEYDNQGNLIRQNEIATGNVREMEWDYHNRLVAVVDKDSEGNETQFVEFTYDMFGRRLSKTVDGEATYFVYDRDNVILDFIDVDGIKGEAEAELDKRYLHGERVDQILAQEDGAGDVNWHMSDHLGSVRDLVDNGGDAVNHYVYDSFGNVISQTGETVISRYLYTGREWDKEIGLQFNRGRFYHPELGIFINEDPISFSGGTPNLYGYVENNPINAIDPFGTTSRPLLNLLTIAKPRNGLGDSIYYYPQSPNYSTALIKATTWFYLITDPARRTGRNNPSPGIPQMKWLLNAPLKYEPAFTTGIKAGGQGILRPAARSGDDPTIQLAGEKRGRMKVYHQTPRGHQNATEIKFLWKDSDKQCPLIPALMPSLNPNPEPQAPGDYPDPVPARQPQSESEPWWEKIPTPPDWIYNIPGKAIEQMFRQKA